MHHSDRLFKYSYTWLLPTQEDDFKSLSVDNWYNLGVITHNVKRVKDYLEEGGNLVIYQVICWLLVLAWFESTKV